MLLVKIISWAAVAVGAGAALASTSAHSTAGVEALVKRRLPQHSDKFEFAIVNAPDSKELANDTYSVTSTHDGRFLIRGNTVSALLSG